MTFAAVIFDLDGTLLDTESQSLAAGRMAFESVGLRDFEGVLHGLIGVDVTTGLRMLRQAYPDADLERMNRVWEHEADRLHREGIPLKPGALELLDLLDEMRLPKAIATSSFRTQAHRKLDHAGLAGRVAQIITRDDVTNPKPHAEPFLKAAGLLDQDPLRCLAFEDSEAGAQSAKAAGMRVVQVKDVITPSGKHAHFVADSLLEGARMAGLV